MEVNISSLISKIREELQNVEDNFRRSQRDKLFELQSMDLEIHFAFVKSNKSTNGIDLKIISLGSEKEVRTEQIQKITLKYRVPDALVGTPGARAAFEEEDKFDENNFKPIPHKK